MNGWIPVCGSCKRVTNPPGKGWFVAGLIGNGYARQDVGFKRGAWKVEACLEELVREVPDLELPSCQFCSGLDFA